jgi:hypothetical protein
MPPARFPSISCIPGAALGTRVSQQRQPRRCIWVWVASNERSHRKQTVHLTLSASSNHANVHNLYYDYYRCVCVFVCVCLCVQQSESDTGIINTHIAWRYVCIKIPPSGAAFTALRLPMFAWYYGWTAFCKCAGTKWAARTDSIGRAVV